MRDPQITHFHTGDGQKGGRDSMTTNLTYRYEMVNIRPGYVIVERDLFSSAVRSYFSAEPVPPKEEYREGNRIWKYSGMAQSFQFDVRDNASGEIIKFRELLGLLYYGSSPEESDIHRIGEIAHENRISVYAAITYEAVDGSRNNLSPEKIRILNKCFNERIKTPDKKILILPDLFNLYKAVSYGEIMIDFGLTSMEES